MMVGPYKDYTRMSEVFYVGCLPIPLCSDKKGKKVESEEEETIISCVCFSVYYCRSFPKDQNKIFIIPHYIR